MRVTVLRSFPNEYGQIQAVGSIATVGDAYGASLIYNGQATDTDSVLSAPGNKPYDVTPTQLRGVYTLATLPNGSLLSTGAGAWTSDGGLVVWNGSTWGASADGSRRHGGRAILLGDSLNANHSTSANSITTLTVSNGVATVTTSGNCYVYPGNYVVLGNAGDPTGADEFNGRCVLAIGAPADNQFTFATTRPDGNYSTIAGQGWLMKFSAFARDGALVSHLSGFLGGAINVIANYAQGGTTSDVTVGILPKILAGPAADFAFIQFGTNDAGFATDNATAQTRATSVIANYITCCRALLAIGTIPVIGITPFAGSPANTYFRNLCVTLIRKGVLDYAALESRVIVVDNQEAFANGNAANGDAVANSMFSDGIHPIPGGWQRAARIAVQHPVFKRLAKAESTIWIGDDAVSNSTTTGLTSLVQNPGFTGTTGTNSGNTITGSVPTNWTVQTNTLPATTGCSFTPASTRTVPTGANPNIANLSTCLAVSLTPTTDSTGISLWSASFPSKMLADRWYRAGITIQPTNNWSGIKQVTVRFFISGTLAGRSTNTIGTATAMSATNTSSNPWVFLSTDQPFTIATDLFYIPPASTIQSALLILDVTASGAGAANFELSQPFVVQGLTNPYV